MTLDWTNSATTTKEFIDMTMKIAKDKFSWLGLRDYVIYTNYKFFRDAIYAAIDMLTEGLRDMETPPFCNTVPTDEERATWKDDNEVCTFEGMWDFFGYRIPVYCDDYGQQNYIKIYDKRTNETVEIGNGAYNFGTEYAADRALFYIGRNYVYDLKKLVLEKTGFDMDEMEKQEEEENLNN